MNFLQLITDSYERKARLYPALVLILPVACTLAATFSGSVSLVQTALGIFAACGGTYLIAQLARDEGKRKEATLYARWGGKPSVAILRHGDSRIDPITKARYHKALTTLVKGTKIPPATEEASNLVLADQTYAAWSSYLRVKTREDMKRFPLLFQELTSYGYRRNVWGLRPVGIISTGTLCVVTIVWNIRMFLTTGSFSDAMMLTSGVGIVFLLLWVFRCSPAWVRIPADAYAARLAEAVDTISGKGATTARAAQKESRLSSTQ